MSSSRQETGASDAPINKCSQQESEPSGSDIQTPNYICSICRNDDRLRGKSIDAIMEDLLSKFDTANTSFTDTTTKLESLIDDNTKFESHQSTLTEIKNTVNEISDKSKCIEDRLSANEALLQTFDQYIKDLTNQKAEVNGQQYHIGTDTNVEDGLFSIGPSNGRVINKIPTLLVNPTNHIDQLHDNFLPAGLRTSLVEYLETCYSFVATGNRMLAQFGHPYKYMNGYGNKKLSEIPGPINSVINWAHEIAKPVLSESSVRYSITFRSIKRCNRNSTVIIGDSNTHNIYFSDEKNKRNTDLGREIVGKRITAYTIDDINPEDVLGFQNVYVQVGLNNIKNKLASIDGSIDIEGTFDRWLCKLIAIKQLCPYSRIIVAHIPPIRIRALNDRAIRFNAMIFSSRNTFWQHVGFDGFLGSNTDLLDKNFARYYNTSTGFRDRIHLGKKSISKLSLLIRDVVLRPRGQVDNRFYAAVVNTPALLPTKPR